MREILFRGKRIDNGEWAVGYLGVFKDKTQIYVPFTEEEERKYRGHIFSTIGGSWYTVDPSTVGQYTGQKDVNGERIWEGDVLHYTGWIDEYDDYCYVVFDCAEFALKFTTMDKQTASKEAIESCPLQRGLFEFCEGKNAFEKIGNIYDNPELLEGGPDNGN